MPLGLQDSLSWSAGCDGGLGEPRKLQEEGLLQGMGLPVQKEEAWGLHSRGYSQEGAGPFLLNFNKLAGRVRQEILCGGCQEGQVLWEPAAFRTIGWEQALHFANQKGSLKKPLPLSTSSRPLWRRRGKVASTSRHSVVLQRSVSPSLHFGHLIITLCLRVCLSHGRLVSLETVLFPFASLGHIKGPDAQ